MVQDATKEYGYQSLIVDHDWSLMLHTRFRLTLNLTTLHDLERPLSSLFQNTVFFEPAAKIWMTILKHTISYRNVVRGLYSFCQYRVFADICGGSLEKGRQTTVGWSKTVIFGAFARCIFRTMHDITQLWGMCIIGKEEEDEEPSEIRPTYVII